MAARSWHERPEWTLLWASLIPLACSKPPSSACGESVTKTAGSAPSASSVHVGKPHGSASARPTHAETHHGSHGNPGDLDAYFVRMEAPDRAEWQKPDQVIAELALAPGAVVCDIGAGPGYFSLRLGKAVGDTGLVYAVDVEPRAVTLLRDRIERSGTSNVVPVLALADDPLLPPHACDLVLIVNTLHHFAAPVEYLKRLQRSLRDGGRIVNIDYHARPTPVGPPLQARVDRAAFLSLAEKAGLELEAEHDFLPHQYFVELVAKRPAEPRGSRPRG